MSAEQFQGKSPEAQEETIPVQPKVEQDKTDETPALTFWDAIEVYQSSADQKSAELDEKVRVSDKVLTGTIKSGLTVLGPDKMTEILGGAYGAFLESVSKAKQWHATVLDKLREFAASEAFKQESAERKQLIADRIAKEQKALEGLVVLESRTPPTVPTQEPVSIRQEPSATKKGFFARVGAGIRKLFGSRSSQAVASVHVEPAEVLAVKEAVFYNPENVLAASTFNTELVKILHGRDKKTGEVRSQEVAQEEILKLLTKDFKPLDPAKFELVKNRILFETAKAVGTWPWARAFLIELLAERKYLTYTKEGDRYAYHVAKK